MLPWLFREALGRWESQYTKLLVSGVLTRPAGCPETQHSCVLGHHQLPQGKSSTHVHCVWREQCVKCRTKLRVALSLDGGGTWARAASVEEEVGASLRFHYPTLHQYGCQLLVAYSKFWSKATPEFTHSDDFHNQGIKLARIDLGQWPDHAYRGFHYT